MFSAKIAGRGEWIRPEAETAETLRSYLTLCDCKADRTCLASVEAT
jgi:hypothetical protein